jgi:hypothetical protein
MSKVRPPLGGSVVKQLAMRLAFALVVVLVSAELFLQVASWLTRTVGLRGELEARGFGADTILCVGDSHTYGLPLPQAESYPSQLEVALAERHPDRSFEVVNLGIPGISSGYASNRLEKQMLQLRPRMVIVWVGINNHWNAVERSDPDAQGVTAALRRGLLRSRLYRLASIAWYTRTSHQYDPEQHGGWYDGEMRPSSGRPGAATSEHPAPGLARDLSRMARTARALDTPIVFVTYPMRKQRPVNLVIEKAAFDNGVLVIDGNRAFERAIAEGHAIRDLIDLSAGPHPTALLYGYIVEALAPIVDAALGQRAG